MEMRLEPGRPADCSGRQAREVRAYDFLDSLGIPYVRIDHAPADTMEVCRAIDECLDTVICKNLFLCNRQQTAFYLLMMPGNKVFKTKELSSQIGSSRLSFGSAERMLEYLDVLPGSVSVLGLMNDREHRVQLLVDEDILRSDTVGCHPCINTSSLRLSVRDVFEVLLPSLGRSYHTVHLVGEE